MLEIRKNSTIKKGTVLLFSCCIFFVLCFSCDKIKSETFDENIVLKINNIPVSKEEYKLFLDEEKAMTFNYFYQKYGVEKSNTFWTTKINNETPINYIKEKANKHLVEVKIIQEYAAKINLVKPFNFKVFVEDWMQENKNRAAKHKAGEIVYGPINTNQRDYYFYLQSNLEIRLKDKLNENLFIPTETALENHFNQIKKQHFSYIDTINIEYLSFPYRTSKQREKSLKKVKKAYSIALEKNSISLIKIQFKNTLYQQKEFYADEQLYGEENPDRALKDFASTLKDEEIRLFDPKNQMNSSIYIVKLLKANKISIRNFKDVRKEVLYYYKEHKYKLLIDSLRKNAVVIFNDEVYNKVSILN